MEREQKNAEEEKTVSVWETLSAVNVNGHTETKTQNNVSLTYLSWAWAWSEVMKRYPDATYTIYKDGENRPFIYEDGVGFMVFTTVTIEGITREMWLPVMDGANRAMKKEPYTVQTRTREMTVAAATMMDINKTIMRCLTKNLAMFGLGVYIYAGEDLPEAEREEQDEKRRKFLECVFNAESVDDLKALKEANPELCKDGEIKSRMLHKYKEVSGE